MLLIKSEGAPTITSKWWMTSKKKLYMTKRSLLLYSKFNLKRKSYKSEESPTLIAALDNPRKVLVPLYQNNIFFVWLASLKTWKSYLILMTSYWTNTILNVEKIETYKKSDTKWINVNCSSVNNSKKLLKSFYVKLRKHLKVFHAEDIFNYGEFIGGETLI